MRTWLPPDAAWFVREELVEIQIPDAGARAAVFGLPLNLSARFGPVVPERTASKNGLNLS